MKKLPRTFAALFLAALGCSDEPGDDASLSRIPQGVRVECAADSSMEQRDSWSCPGTIELACSAAGNGVLRVLSPSNEVCDADALSVTYAEPLTPGTHALSVRDEQDKVLCSGEAVVRRGADLRLVPKQVNLWPPNHKLHEIRVEDCVEIVGACPGEVLVPRFIWASSDEPEDARGDGHHAPDITLSADCQQLSLRSERQGPSDGRVYTLGVRLVDALGESYEASCTVSVDHDQSGRAAADSSEAYRLELDGTTPGFPNCVDADPVIF
jgi:hypothetical protein